MWVNIIFCVSFVLYLIFNMLVEGVHKDLGEDPGPTLNPHNLHLRYKISVAHAKYFHSNFSPTLVGLIVYLISCSLLPPTSGIEFEATFLISSARLVNLAGA